MKEIGKVAAAIVGGVISILGVIMAAVQPAKMAVQKALGSSPRFTAVTTARETKMFWVAVLLINWVSRAPVK